MGVVGPTKLKAKLACILEADEFTRLRMGESLPNHHEDHIAGKGDNSLQHYILVRKFIPVPQAMKIRAAKAAIPPRYIDVTRATGTTLDVMLERRMDDYCNIEGDHEIYQTRGLDSHDSPHWTKNF